MNAKKLTNADAQIGNRIRMRRVIIGMSQESLGRLLGITFQQVQKYEKGVNRVGGGRLQEIAKHLGVRTNYFFDEAPGGVELPVLSAQTIEMMQAFESLTPRLRTCVRSIVMDLAAQTGAV